MDENINNDLGIKVSHLWYIALFMVSRSIKKLFSIDGVNICLKIFFNRFCPMEVWGYSTLRIS